MTRIAVDAMGGVTIDIDSSELKYINDYITATSQSSGIKSKQIIAVIRPAANSNINDKYYNKKRRTTHFL